MIGGREARVLLLGVAAAALIVALFRPSAVLPRPAYDFLLVVDITGSMNARDYTQAGKPESRLQRAKSAVRALLAALPCRSRVGLAIFTERQSFVLFEPARLCGNFAAIDGAIDSLDWRMAWEGDSYVARGLYSAIDLAREAHAELIFLTDGHEMPPLPYTGAPEFPGEPGKVGGVIVGVGALTPVPIPKFDELGNQTGFWTMTEVPQENRSGTPPPDAASRAGYNPRNAPFGGAAAVGTEHLTSVREDYLRKLARATALGYVRLTSDNALERAVLRGAHARRLATETDLRPLPAAVALAALTLFYLMPLWRGAK